MTYPTDYQHQDVLAFMQKANQETPTAPTIPSLEVRKLRAKLIMEEAIETVHALGFSIDAGDDNFIDLRIGDILFFHRWPPDLSGISDGCADIKVVTVGTEIACGINGAPIFDEVMRSNMTKFEGGSIREDGKILKGPHYEPPSIEPILKAQGMK